MDKQSPRSRRMADAPYAALVALASLALGVLARLPYLFPEDPFPLGDGGLFVQMINAIKANRYLLPEFVSYNGAEIPFAYPPLGFYLAVLVSRLFGLSTLQVVRYLPLFINLLTVAAFAALASRILKDRLAFLASALIFPLILQTYLWSVKGGGISRSPGFFFTTLALYFAAAYADEGRKIHLAGGTLALGFAVLSHPEWALVAPVSLAALFLFQGERLNGLKRIRAMALFYAGALILISPWWITILLRFGPAPILMAGKVGKADFLSAALDFLGGKALLLNVTLLQDFGVSFFAALGLAICLYRRQFLLPVWLTAAYFVSPKNAPIPGVLAVALLSAVGLRGLDELAARVASQLKKKIPRALPFAPSAVYLSLLIPLGLFHLIRQPVLHSIKPGERAAMNFAAENTPADSKFVVISGQSWYEADAAEWFPLLAQRQSLTTPQGLEWVSAERFLQISAETHALAALFRAAQAGSDSDELVRYVESRFPDFDYVVLFGADLEKNAGGFLSAGRYELAYSKKNALIFKHVSP